MTAFPAARSDAHPGFIICPGGGYWRHSPITNEPVAAWLNSIGISAYLLRYALKPAKHPAPLNDLQRAIRTVRSSAAVSNLDPAKIGVIGFSAGGHLATTAGTRFDNGNPTADDPIERVSSRPDALVLGYPVISFEEYRHEGTVLTLLGDEPDEQIRNELSNHRQVTHDTPPSFIWHTVDDPVVPVQNSLLFANALIDNAVPCELHLFPHGDHGLGLAADNPSLSQWTALCETWLKGLGFLP
jgi:acetyl esterase/lipase